MNNASNFNWAILAPGKIARKFVSDFEHVAGARIHAVASRSIERATAFAEEFNVPNAVGSYEALSSIPDIDCVYIASPHVGHFEHTMMCLEAGLNVLCEKPFAMNQMQVEQMVALAKAKNVFLMEALWTRFFPFIGEVDGLIHNGVIGKPWSLSADFGFDAGYDPKSRLFDLSLGGGALLDIGIYPVFIALYYFGFPDSITATAEKAPTGADQINHITFQYKDGRNAKLHATLLEKTACECIIRGDQGEITIDSRFHESKSISFVTNHEETQIDCGFEGKGYRWEIEHVQKCIRQGLTESPKMPLDFSMKLIDLLDRIRAIIDVAYPTV